MNTAHQFDIDMDSSRMERMPDYGFPEEFHHHDSTPAPTPAPTPIVEIKNVLTKVIRSANGVTESRLYRELVDDSHHQFFIEQVEIAPYAKKRTDLVRPHTKKIMTESEAFKAFDKFITNTYPPTVMRNGHKVPTHLQLL